jgi:hypothetical protein
MEEKKQNEEGWRWISKKDGTKDHLHHHHHLMEEEQEELEEKRRFKGEGNSTIDRFL